VEATAETAGAIRRIAIVVTRSKNDRRPFTREMHRVSHPFLCVVKAVVAWAVETKDLPKHWPFLSLDSSPGPDGRAARVITRSDIADILKASSRGLGMNPEDYSTHSLRIGGATHLFHSGAPDQYIMYMGNWRSPTFRQYCRAATRRTGYQESMVKLRLVMRKDFFLQARQP
jgi:hypothetical protein